MNMSNDKKNIAKAILLVMKEVKGMEKNSRVGIGKSAYDGTKYADVADRFNDAMEQNGLCILPIGIEEETKIDRWQEDTNYGVKTKQSIFTKVKTKYMLLHDSGESIELAGYGHGVDPQDKSAGKATTYALKNALLYMFLTPVGKMDDTDLTHSATIEVPQKTKPPFTELLFEKAWKNNATEEQIKSKYLLSDEVKSLWVEFQLDKQANQNNQHGE